MKRNIEILAAIFARIDIGCKNPSTESVVEAIKYTRVGRWVADFVVHFCAEFMEDEESEKAFYDTAAAWEGRLSEMDDGYFEVTFPESAKLYDD